MTRVPIEHRGHEARPGDPKRTPRRGTLTAVVRLIGWTVGLAGLAHRPGSGAGRPVRDHPPGRRGAPGV
jgi:hypothetical protein